MPEPIPYMTPFTPLDFKNQKSGLTVFGIILIAMGILSGCSVLADPAALLFYAAISVCLIWAGTACIRPRRWVRPMILILATITLCTGIVSTISSLVIIPTMQKSIRLAQTAATTGPAATAPAAAPPAITSTAVNAGVAIGVLMLAIMLLLIPAIFLWFFRKQDVRRTLEHYDPNARWTDERPMPVLAMTVVCALFTIDTITSLFQPATRVFGATITGWPRMPLLIGVIILMSLATVLNYRMRIVGWYLAVGVVLLYEISAAVTAFGPDPDPLANASGATTQQVELLNAMPAWQPMIVQVLQSFIVLAALAYAFRAKKHFNDHAQITASTQ